MPPRPLNLVVIGLALSSAWGNGHATTYRALLKGVHARGHRVTFLERDVPWYAANRDLPKPDFCTLHLYRSVEDLRQRFGTRVRDADAVIVGSYVPDGVSVARWVQETAKGPTLYYDIDTPVTMAKLARGDFEYITPELIAGFDIYLSFSGGPVLERLERECGARRAAPLYCSVDPERHRPELMVGARWDLSYLGTYSADRQPKLERLLIEVAEQCPRHRFVVAGPQYDKSIRWPANVERIEHLAPAEHKEFYSASRFTLNITRSDMTTAGYSPSVRLFEAAACGVPVISDEWPGLESFFRPGEEILTASDCEDVKALITQMKEADRFRIGRRARRRVLAEHSGEKRARELERLIGGLTRKGPPAAGERKAPA